MEIKRKAIEYHDDQALLIGELFYSEASFKKLTIIIYPAFEGRGQFVIDYANVLAKQGFNVFVADMYGNAEVAKTLADCFRLVKPFLNSRALTRKRANLAFETISANDHVDANNIAAIGFCFGGMCMLEVARSGKNLKAGVSFHGVLTASELESKPISSKLLILHGYDDPQSPPDALPKFAAEMQTCGVKDWTFVYFGDAKHSFTDPKTGSYEPTKEKEMGREYNKIAATRSCNFMLDFLKNI